MIPSADTTLAVVMDVDGVVSPVHGKSEFGDDVIAGHLFGPVSVSATVCRDLDQLSAQPGATFVWLTDWRTDMRAAMNPFPGHDWDTIADPDNGLQDAIVRAGDRWGEMPWWKWWALDVWLNTHPQIRTLVWCDDHLSRTASIEEGEGPQPRPVRTRGEMAVTCLAERGVHAVSIAPNSAHGLTLDDLELIRRTVSGHASRWHNCPGRDKEIR